MRSSLLILLLGSCAAAQAPFDLNGIVDLHVHCNPDSAPPRRIDAFEVAQLFKKEGLRAFVIKSHYLPTSQLAYAVNKIVPEVTAYGAITLDRSVGGINPEAVEHFARVTGEYARIVWMPTQDAENFVRNIRPPRPFVSVSKDGKLLPEVIEVLQVIKKYNLTLATGHSTAQEDLMLVRAARRLGIDRIIVTHAMPQPVRMTIPQMQEAAGMGAYIEFVYNLIYPDPEADARNAGRKRLTFADYAQAIHAVGAEHCFISSDVGQPMRPTQTEAWKEYIAGLMKAGVTAAEINIMAKRNPARLIGL
jgi:Family of unknown function (DUF6282)